MKREERKNACCGTCLYYNGIVGDGCQYCDRREIFVEDTDYCIRYQYCDKSEFEEVE